MSERVTQQQQELFADYSPDQEVLRELRGLSPPLPSVLRYYDEFEDAVRSIRNPAALTVFEISAFGKKFSDPLASDLPPTAARQYRPQYVACAR